MPTSPPKRKQVPKEDEESVESLTEDQEGTETEETDSE